MDPLQRQRILRRTLVGSTLAAAVGALLWASDRSEGGGIVLFAGTLLGAAAVLEAARLVRPRDGSALLPLLAGLGALALARLSSARRAAAGERGDFDARADLWCELGSAVGVALLVYGVVLLLARPRPRPGAGVGATFLGIWGALALAPIGRGALAGGDAPGDACVAAAMLLPAVALVPIAYAFRTESVRSVLAVGGLALWVLPALPWLHEVWWTFGQSGLVSLLVLAKVGDVAGYYVGNALGRRHPFPRVSPGKTTEGCLGSLAAGTFAGGALVLAGALPDGRLGVLGGLLAGAAINLAAQAGDLLESWVKRRAGVKDSGPWFGPSGGVLDLVDSLLLAVPAALLVWPWLFRTG